MSNSLILSVVLASSLLPDQVAVPLLTSEGTVPVVLATSAPERPGHFAEREELNAALRTRTPEALALFIDRHPHSRYRPTAERALRRLHRPR